MQWQQKWNKPLSTNYCKIHWDVSNTEKYLIPDLSIHWLIGQSVSGMAPPLCQDHWLYSKWQKSQEGQRGKKQRNTNPKGKGAMWLRKISTYFGGKNKGGANVGLLLFIWKIVLKNKIYTHTLYIGMTRGWGANLQPT